MRVRSISALLEGFCIRLSRQDIVFAVQFRRDIGLSVTREE